MCNRVRASFEFRETKIRWNLFSDLPEFKPSHNVAPDRGGILSILHTDTESEGRLMYWPLIPSFAKEMKITYSTTNAAAERLLESSVYKRLLNTPINGFYEWQGQKPSKTPYYVYLKSREPFALGGLWDTWKKPDSKVFGKSDA